MGRRSWFHKIYSKDDYYKLKEFIENDDRIFLVGFAIIDGTIALHEMLGGFCCGEGKTLTVLSQSNGSLVIEEMISKKVIEDWNAIVLLDNISPSELEDTPKGTRLKKATYLTYEEFLEELENQNFLSWLDKI